MPLPLQSRLPRTHRIVAVRKENAFVQSFVFDTSLGARPGQFLMAWVPCVNEVPLSIADDDGKQLTITFSGVGETTKALAAMEKGGLVGLRGPFGTFYEWKPKQHLILVAGGYGAAPMFFAAKEAAKDGCSIDVIVGARSKEYLLYIEAFRALKGVTLHVATDDGSVGHKGFNVDLLEQVLTSHVSHFTSVFACGPERMLVRVSQITAAAGAPSQLSLERYMKCGFGLCGNCVVDPLGIRLCVEGPVVKNETAQKITEFGKYHRDGLGHKKQW